MTCTVSDGYVCTCNSGWANAGGAATGECTIRECPSGLRCENEANCVEASGNVPAHCDCLPGFTGTLCESKTMTS